MTPSCRFLRFAGLLALGCSTFVHAQTRANRIQDIRAGMLILDSDRPKGDLTNEGRCSAPFALLNLQNATGIKPAGWNFYNPHAPGTVTQQIRNRYQAILAAGAPLPQVGDSITKRNAEYWNVYLGRASEANLLDYDFLIASPQNYVSLSPPEREKLRKFVDKGGVLWIDLGGLGSAGVGSTDETNSWPLAFVPRPAAGANAYTDPANPLLNTPLKLTGTDLNYLNSGQVPGQWTIGAVNLSDYGASYNSYFDQFLPLYAQFQKLNYVAGFDNYPTLAVGRVGEGAIVVSSRGASIQLNRVSSANGFGVNTGYFAMTPIDLDADAKAAAKLAVNIASLSSDYREASGGPRKSGSNSLDVGAPVLTRFADETGGARPNSAPTIYKGVVVSTAGNKVTVYSAKPNQDLDGDGDPDDGIANPDGTTNDNFRDISVGKRFDVIWSSPTIASGNLSSPTCVEVPDSPYKGLDGRYHTNFVLVTDGSGALHVFDLFPKAPNGRLIGGVNTELFNITPPSGATSGASNQAPTFSEGLAFMTDNVTVAGVTQGRVWLVDLGAALADPNQRPLTSTNAWRVGGSDIVGQSLPPLTAGATVGYIPIQDNAGGSDRVLYLAGNLTAGPQTTPTLVSLWLGAKGEKPAGNLDEMIDDAGTVLKITTRAATQGNLPVYLPPDSGAASSYLGAHGVKLTLLDKYGNPMPLTGGVNPDTGTADDHFSFSHWIQGAPENAGGGVLNFVLATGETGVNFKNYVKSVRIDYTIDWGLSPQEFSPTIERGRIQFPTSPVTLTLGSSDLTQRMILGNVALSAKGTIHLCVGPQFDATTASSVNAYPAVASSEYAIREDAGRGHFRVVSRYTLYPRFTSTLDLSGVQPHPSVVEDYDPLTNLPGIGNFLLGPGGDRNLRELRFVGAPVVRGDQAYAVALGKKASGVPATIVMAFKAEPETPEIRIANLPDDVRLTQADFERSPLNKAQEQSNTAISALATTNVANNSFTYDKERGVLRIENLATVSQGQIQDCLSLSQPVTISGTGMSSNPREPDAFGDRWNPLEWYCVYNGFEADGAPVMTGDTLFMAGASGLPNILDGLGFGLPQGIISAMAGTIASNNPFMVHPASRVWMNQVGQISITGTGITPNPDIRMPQGQGVTSFNDYKLRLRQSTLGTSSVAYGVAGGNGTLVAWADTGVFGLNRADFVICDQGRLLKVDAAGNPIFTSTAFAGSGPTGGGFAANVHPLVRPVKAYSLTENEFLVVDAGGNRVVRLDTTGVESRSIDTFVVDADAKPLGYTTNEVATLKDPRDATTWSEFVPAAQNRFTTSVTGPEYWTHYLVADTGNQRLLELIDRYTVDTNNRIGGPVQIQGYVYDSSTKTATLKSTPALGVLYWQTSANISGKSFDYNSVSRVYLATPSNPHYVYVAGVGSGLTTRSSAGLDNAGENIKENTSGTGSVIVFDPTSAAGTLIFNQFDAPDLSTTAFFNPVTQKYDLFGSTAQPSRRFSGVTSVTARGYYDTASGQSRIKIMVSDGSGVYEFSYDPANPSTSGSLGQPVWMINEAAFKALRSNPFGSGQFDVSVNALRFRPSFARRLDSGEVLIVNGYGGQTRGGVAYSGEVLMLNGDQDATNNLIATDGNFQYGKPNLGFIPRSLRFDLPPLTGVRDLRSPVFADRR